MLIESQKFADLDIMGQTILDGGDRSLFAEAVQCYQIGSHRAAVILTWCATADCLKRKVKDLATEGDTQAQQALTELKAVEGQASFEETLIACARKCELIDDYDERALRFSRDVRSKCAHPTGVVPSAEAVRHIFHICIHSVLSQKGYHGMAYVQDVVTVQFDDPYFLPNDDKAREHCRAIAEKVPKRSWPQFASIAAERRPGPHTEAWQRNALIFFRVLLSLADDLSATYIAAGLKGFEANAADFFAILVGLDNRVTMFWDAQKRAQARARLNAVSAVRMTADHVHSWAVICSADGLEEGDRELLRQKWGGISRYLGKEEDFLQRQRPDLTNLLQEMLLTEPTSAQAVYAIRNLAGSRLFDNKSDSMQVIVQTIVERFAREVSYRELMERVSTWTGQMLITLLELSELFLEQCSDENPDDALFILEAARELATRSPTEVPQEFEDVVNRVLRKELLGEWAAEESVVGTGFRRQLALLLQQEQFAFSGIDRTISLTGLDDVEEAEMIDEAGESTTASEDR
jgi:hypothetical protein